MSNRLAGPAVLLAGAVYVGAGVAGSLPEGLPFWNHHGGQSEPAPKGVVIYQGQEAHSISNRLVIPIGRGVATVAVQAAQNYDKKGGILDGDFQSTNATVKVDDHGNPAAMPVTMEYCSDGYIEVNKAGNGDVKNVTYHVGSLGVCGAHLDFGDSNVSNKFNQDSAPKTFFGDFVSFVVGTVEETAKAAPCPKEELNKYTGPAADRHYEEVLAAKFNVDKSLVIVEDGTSGQTSPADQLAMKARLNAFANKQDPRDPTKSFPALKISFLTANASAVEASCYFEIGGTKLQDLQAANVNLTPAP
jgi:hypothetical protein